MLDGLRRWFKHLTDQDEVEVEKGDSLWVIAEDITGDGERWKELADANANRGWTKDHKIFPGEKLKLPESWL